MPASTGSMQPAQQLRFGSVCSGDAQRGIAASIEWHLRRNCSLSPAQLLAVYASLCVISLGTATYFWLHGATLVMPFAWAELLLLAIALAVYARHAVDGERITLQPGRLTVELLDGSRVERVEFVPQRVRVAVTQDAAALIELSEAGRTIAVGRHVRPELRAVLAEEFRSALRGAEGTTGSAA